MVGDLDTCSTQTEVDNDDKVFESWSSTQIKTTKLRHTWTINNFSLRMEEKGEKLVSPTFSAPVDTDRTEWCLWLYPRGYTEKDNVSLFFLLIGKSNMGEMQVKFTSGIVNAKGENINLITNFRRLENNESWGYPYFVKREFLFNELNNALPNDKLIVYCEITVLGRTENISGIYISPPSDLAIDVTFLYKSTEFSDVTLCAGGKEFPAHKVILAARSPVFRTMFHHDMKESRNNLVQIIDIDEESLCEMLRYMYTGKINDLEKIAPRLLNIAEKYEIDKLKIMCENALCKSLSLKNVVEIFILSDMFRATNLKIQVKRFIAANASVLGNAVEFQSMFLKYPHLAIEAFCALSDNSSIL